jgi:hypothetical protein
MKGRTMKRIAGMNHPGEADGNYPRLMMSRDMIRIVLFSAQRSR